MLGTGGGSSSTEYRIFETDRFTKDLRAIARSGESGIVRKLRQIVYPQLRVEPFYGPNIKKLRAWNPDTWRYRIGSWRFFYEIDGNEKVVYMIAAARRGSAY